MSDERSPKRSEGLPPSQDVFRQRKNQRSLVTKLELPDDPVLQQKKIAQAVFNTDYENTLPAIDNSDWQTTDYYYEKAKTSYDNVVAPFQRPPVVYKLEKHSSAALVSVEDHELEKTSEQIEDELNTVLDPYAIPKPWMIKYDRDDNMYYFNPETGARKIVRPDAVWKGKLERLEKLVPREDYSGWEYKENEKERRARLRAQLQFDKKLHEEIKRRQENPTDNEMVEDALYDIIHTIETNAQKELDREIAQRRKEQRASWHPSSLGHRMKQLELLPRPELEGDEEDTSEPRMNRRITDLEYEDKFVLTATGFTLPKSMPADLLEIHEAEREEKRLLEEEREFEEERIRRLPVLEKASMLVTQAIEEGPKEAARTLAKGIEYRAMVIPRKLKALDRRVVMSKSQEVVVSGVSSLLKIARNPIHTAKEVSNNLSTLYRQMFPNKQESTVDMDQLMNDLDEEANTAEEEAAKVKADALAISLKANRIQAIQRESKYSTKGRRGGLPGDEELVRPPVKIDLPDCALVTLTLKIAAPPPAVLEHSYGQKMFLKARDKLLKKSLNKNKNVDIDQSVDTGQISNPKERYLPLQFQHNFKHNDNESPPATPQKPPAFIASSAAKSSKMKKANKLRNKSRNPSAGFGEEEKDPNDSDEEELRKAKEKLPSFLQDPPKKYNNVARKQFENQLIFDLAVACGIPEHYFTIEEVRNLPENDPSTLRYIERNKEIYAEETIRLAFEEEKRRRLSILEQHEIVEFARIQAQHASVPLRKVLQSAKLTSTKLLSSIPESKIALFGNCLPNQKMLEHDQIAATVEDPSSPPMDHKNSGDDQSGNSIGSFDTENTRDKLAEQARKAKILEVVDNIHYAPQSAENASNSYVSISLPCIGNPEGQLANDLVLRWSEKAIANCSAKEPLNKEISYRDGHVPFSSDVSMHNNTGQTAQNDTIIDSSELKNTDSNAVVNNGNPNIGTKSQCNPDDFDDLTIESREDFNDTHNICDFEGTSPLRAQAPTIPKMPQKFVLGITNPSDLFNRYNPIDKDFWFLKDVKLSSEEEIQLKRLKHLKQSATLMLPNSDNAEGDALKRHIAKETAKREAKLKLKWLQEQRAIVKQLAKVQIEAKLNVIKEKTALAMSKLKKADNAANNKAILPPIEPGHSPMRNQQELDTDERERQQSIKALQDMDHLLSEQEDAIKQGIVDEENSFALPVDNNSVLSDGAADERRSESSGDTNKESENDNDNDNDNANAGSADEESENLGIDASEKLAIWPMNQEFATNDHDANDVEENEEEKQVIYSCEVSFFVHVDSTIKSRHEGLADLTSADVAKFIEIQMNQQFSDLLKGSIAKNIVNVKIRPSAFSPKYFTRWEQRWVYIISPTYFGYSTKKIERKSRNKGNESRLPNGLQVQNPVSNFTEDEKTTFIGLGGGKLPIKKKGGGADEGAVIDLDVDDIAAELGMDNGSTGPKIYRPNMSQLTVRDVEKCKRIYKAFEEVFETQMKRGLVDGKRLRREQFDAMKDRDTAKRIYDITKQKLNRDSRLANEPHKFIPHMTKITSDVFSGWKKELLDDEEILLRDKKKKAEEARENRRKMANSRKLYEKQRNWMVAKLTSLNSVVKTVTPFGPVFQEEIESEIRDIAKLHNPEANAIEVLKIKTRMAAHEKLVNAEEKMTKKLYSNIAIWVQENAIINEFKENEEKLGAQGGLEHSSLENLIGDENMSVVSLGSVEQGWAIDQQQAVPGEQRRLSIPFRRVSFAEEDINAAQIIEQLIFNEKPVQDTESVRSTAGSDIRNDSTVIGIDGEVIESRLNSIMSEEVENNASENKRRSSVQTEASEFSQLVGPDCTNDPGNIDHITTLNTRRNSTNGGEDFPRRRTASTGSVENGMPKSKAYNEEGMHPGDISGHRVSGIVSAVIPASDPTGIEIIDKSVPSLGPSSGDRRLSTVSSKEAIRARKGSIQMSNGVQLGLTRSPVLSAPSIDSASISVAADAPFITRKDVFAYLTKAREKVIFKKATSDSVKEKWTFTVPVNQRVPFQQAKAAVDETSIEMPSEEVSHKKKENDMIEITVGIDGTADFKEEELELLDKLKWVNIVSSISDFRSCMQTISTEGKNDFTRAEFVLFARLVLDIEPAFSRAKIATIKLSSGEKKLARKEEEDIKKKAAQNKKKSKHEELVDALASGDSDLLSTSASNATGKMTREEGLRRESIRRASNFALAAVRRRMREQAWKTAHQHLFIKMPDKPKYCVICAEKNLEGWVADHDKAEADWISTPDGPFEEFLEEIMEENEPIFLKEEELFILAELEVEKNLKAGRNAQKMILETQRVEHILLARQAMYASVRPIDPLILSQPIESFLDNKETQSGIERVHDQTEISNASIVDIESLLVCVVVKDLVSSMADAVAVQESKDLLIGRTGFSAGSSLEEVDGSDELGSLISSTSDVKPVPKNSTDVDGPQKIPKYILDSKLALVDPTGMSIVPQEASVVEKGDGKGVKIVTPIADLDLFYLEGIVHAAAKGDALSNHLLEGFVSKGLDSQNIKQSIESGFSLTKEFPEISSFDKCAHEILIRVWNKDSQNPDKSGKGDFLGFVILNSADLKAPPKGIRALSLRTDESLSTPKGHDNEFLKVSGSISLKLHATKWTNGTEMNNNKIGFPCEWRLQIVKASKLALVDRNTKTNSFCEVFWRGRAIRADIVEHYSDWLVVGRTTVVERSVDPSWSKEPSATLELPPRWTQCDIPGRGPDGGNLTGGGWVAINQIPADDKTTDPEKGGSLLVRMSKKEHESRQAGEMKTKQISNKFDPRKAFKGAVDAVRVASRLNAHATMKIKNRVENRLKTMKLLYEAEEKERQLLAAEERRMRINDLALTKIKEEQYVLEQKLYEREFTRLIQAINEAPRIVARLRFLMATLTSSGGMLVICEDPATKKELDVVSLPLMYEQDEHELSAQILEMLGTPHKNLVNIVDFSVHQILGFNSSGSASTNERGALIVTNHPKGIPLSEYMAENWMIISDNDFRLILVQVIRAIAALHRHNINHRNLHPEAVTIYNPSEYANVQPATTWGLGTESFGQNDLSAQSYASATSATSTTPGMSHSTSFDPRLGQSQQSINYMHTGWGTHAARNNKPVIELGDYWFLSNPRKPGCQYSNGRADWGHRHTAPPEVLFGQAITERSDIWAFGICCFHWATEGLYPDVSAGKGGLVDLEALIKKLPLKWGPWLHSLLRMCLQKVPRNRALADDLFRFLTLAKASKENSTT